jgi:hypothetical protein
VVIKKEMADQNIERQGDGRRSGGEATTKKGLMISPSCPCLQLDSSCTTSKISLIDLFSGDGNLNQAKNGA